LYFYYIKLVFIAKQATFPSYRPREEWANIISHGLGIPLAVIALIALAIQASQRPEPYAWLVLVYALTMLWTYLTSTVYHATYRAAVPVRNMFHLLDHTAIYLFIAGTYTPVAWYGLPPGWREGILISVWSIAAAGLLSKFFMMGRLPKLSLALYISMGCLIVVAASPLWNYAPRAMIYWLLAGGLCYLIGTVFYSLRQMPYHHAIWHLLVLAGSFCHFWGIYRYL